jgi:endonuclease-3 related protein
VTNKIQEIYSLLFDHFGPQSWWPGETSIEIMVGAVLTQNTNWQNVCKAIANLKNAGVLNYEALTYLDNEEMAKLIRPSGYYNLKAKRLKNLLFMIKEKYDGDIDNFISDELEECRKNLLSVSGVGPETADSILLYVAGKPIFVVDSYTHRVFSRHNLVEEESDYHSIQELFMGALPADAKMMNEYHALIVRVAKEFCRKKNPLCQGCPLEGV